MHRFTLRQLEIFATVVRTGQVKRAASTLHLSQAAVSQALHELADALGITLFERRGREIVPTAAARQLLELVAAPMAALEDVPAQLAPGDAAAELSGEVQVAASNTIARYVLPAALARLGRQHPGLRITVLSGNSAAVEARVAALEADVGFIEGPAQRDDVDVSAWRTDALQVIAPADYPVEGLSAATLAEHPWVVREPGSGTRAVFEQSLALAGHPVPRGGLVMDDSGAIVRAVASGAGLACVSRLAAAQASVRGGVRFVDVPELSLRRPLWCVRRAVPAHSPVVERFLRALDAALDAENGVAATA
ncbi:HTH-type transcriptional regulator CysL [wastewater metagenome]|uniref:HTH-type transcriptional regulator CysL n=3 Tax=root TaxID=1 RepID=A0A5B8RIQ3_9ZZZZ|nr:LysR family transcriptional regulator [Arhodomonas aquaeolei]MCS4504454.1 LysR family transcriptional regulator [Arhodomonas aquaeolei]QEA06647.1 HTH-type transcriptional regulator CysL [uncultured organism]